MLGWLSQLEIWLLISAQVMISWFVRSSLMLGSVLTAGNLLGFYLCLFVPPPHTRMHVPSLSQNKWINTKKKHPKENIWIFKNCPWTKIIFEFKFFEFRNYYWVIIITIFEFKNYSKRLGIWNSVREKHKRRLFILIGCDVQWLFIDSVPSIICS